MKTARTDLDIERFLDDRMTPEEDAAFRQRMASDMRLSDAVQAERAIRSAMRRSAGAHAADHSALREHLLGTVAATPPAAATAARAGGGMPTAFAAMMVTGVVTVLVVIVISLGAMMFWRKDTYQTRTQRTPGPGIPAAQKTTPGTVAAPVQTEPGDRQPGAAGNPRTTGTTSPAAADTQHSMRRTGEAAKPSGASRVPPKSDRAVADEPAAKEKPATQPNVERTRQSTQEARPKVIFRSDSVRTRVKVDIGQP